MDPHQTLTNLLAAIVDRDWERVCELSEALLTWMESGGFPPEPVGPTSLGQRWHRAMTTFICHAATSRANDALKRREERVTR